MNSTDELKALYHTLICDCTRAEDARKACDDQYSRRVSIRSVIAMIEGLTFMMKKVVATTLECLPEVREKLAFSRAEIALLHEESYFLNDNGSTRTSIAHQKFLPNLRFAMACYARLWTSDFLPDCSGTGWEALLCTVNLRNRITHPKSQDDLQISDEEMRLFVSGSTWHRDTMADLLRACGSESKASEHAERSDSPRRDP